MIQKAPMILTTANIFDWLATEEGEDFRDELLAAPSARFTVTADGNSTTDTTFLTITFTRNPELVTPDLTAGEITLSAGLTKGSLTKVSSAVYTLGVTVTAPSTGDQTITITKTDVNAKPVTVKVFKAAAGPPPPAAIGWYGVWYPDGGAVGTPTYPAFDDSFLDLTATTEIIGAKRDLDVTTPPNEPDWLSTGAPGTHALWDDYGYRVFILTQPGIWGAIQCWDTTESFNQTTTFTPISVVVEGVTYEGLLSPSLGAVNPYKFKCV